MGAPAATIRTTASGGLLLRLAPDERLLRLASEGQPAAFEVLFGRHQPALERYCRMLVRHDQDAQDVVQTAAVRALAALRRGVPDAPARPWLFRIAHNEAVSLLRRRRPADDVADVPLAATGSTEATAETRRRLGQLVADLQDLPERQRGALVMRELSGLSHEEIASALGTGVAGAKQAICDARLSLQEFEKGRGMRCADVQRRISDGDGRALRGRPVRAHLRSCADCRALRDAIVVRRADLAALVPPLPLVAAGGILAKLLGGGGAAGAGGAAPAGGAGAAAGLLTSTAAKGLAVAVLATGAGAGAVQVAAPEGGGAPAKRTAFPAGVASPAPAVGAPAGAVTVAPAAGGPEGERSQTARDRRPAGRSARRAGASGRRQPASGTRPAVPRPRPGGPATPGARPPGSSRPARPARPQPTRPQPARPQPARPRPAPARPPQAAPPAPPAPPAARRPTPAAAPGASKNTAPAPPAASATPAPQPAPAGSGGRPQGPPAGRGK